MAPTTQFLKIDITKLTPSQLYISQMKLERLAKSSTHFPITVKNFGRKVVITDGHTRVVHALLEGKADVEIVWDQDDLDFVAYKICLRWCQEQGLDSPAKLLHRIVSHERYQELWLSRCQKELP